MRFAKKSRSDREARDRACSSASWPYPTRHRNRWRAGSRTIARVFCDGARGQQQRDGFHGDAGMSPRPGGSPFVLAARRRVGATGQPLSTGTSGDRNRSGWNGAGRFARSGDAAASGGRCGSLLFGGGSGDRVMAQPARSRPYRKPAVGIGGRSFRRHHPASAFGGGTRAQRRTDALERSRCAFYGIGGRSARSAFFHGRIAASARSSGWRHLVSGMGS